jgi:hypothetical protein
LTFEEQSAEETLVIQDKLQAAIETDERTPEEIETMRERLRSTIE